MNDSNERIIAGAFRLFLENNYEKVSTSMLESEIGLSRGSIFYHVKNKEALFHEMIDKYILGKQSVTNKVDVTDIERKTLYNYLNDYLDGSERTIDSMKNLVSDEAKAYSAYFRLIYQASKYYTGFSEKITEVFQNEYLILEKVVTNAINNGELKEGLDPKDIAHQIRYIFVGYSFEESLKTGAKINEIRSLVMSFYNLIKNE